MDMSPAELAEWLNARRTGFTALLGLRFTAVSPEAIEAEVPVRPELHQPYGLVHGGVYATIVETVCSAGAGVHAHDRGASVVGLENQTSFLRATREGMLRTRAVPVRTGRRSQVWRAEIFDDQDRVVATGQVRLLAIEPDETVAGSTLGREFARGT